MKYVFRALTSERPGSRRRERIFSEWVSHADLALINLARDHTDTDISGHRPEHLQVIDRSLNSDFRRVAESTARRLEENVILVGCYLGEVITRNLGGRWHFPTYPQAAIVLALHSPLPSEKYVYVHVAAMKVQVLRAAREAIERTAQEFSLYNFYTEVARRVGGTASASPRC